MKTDLRRLKVFGENWKANSDCEQMSKNIPKSPCQNRKLPSFTANSTPILNAKLKISFTKRTQSLKPLTQRTLPRKDVKIPSSIYINILLIN
jgi:hypothetical protein